MIEEFYYRLNKYLHNRHLSILLAFVLRGAFFLFFTIKKVFLKNDTVEMGVIEAVDILNRAYPDPSQKPDYSMATADSSVDLSIIIPVYNNVDVVEECINSVINQRTGYQYELILVDDGSTDGAEDIIEQYRSYDNVMIIHQKNGGIASARNTGIEYARGGYIMFVDCDDTVDESIVEELVSAAKQDECDIVMCGHSMIKKEEKKIIDIIPNIHPQINFLGYRNGDEIMNYAGLPWAKVYKRNLFKKVRFFPGYWYEDNIVHFLLFTQCKVFKYIPKSLYNYIWHINNFSHIQEGREARLKMVDHYWLLKAIIEQYRRIGLPRDAVLYTLILKHISAYYYRSISSLPDEIIKAMFIAGRDLLLQNKPEKPVKLPLMLRLTEKAILDRNIALWKLTSLYQ